MKQKINPNKPILITGIIILAISLCVIFPFEYSNANFLTDLNYTFLSLALALLTIMYSLMGKYFFKGILFLLFSIICGIVSWYLLFPLPELDKPASKSLEIVLLILSAFSTMSTFFMGTTTGVVSGLIFFIINYWFLNDENRYKLFFKRLISYLIILSIVSILFRNGSDWIFEISEYFKLNKS